MARKIMGRAWRADHSGSGAHHRFGHGPVLRVVVLAGIAAGTTAAAVWAAEEPRTTALSAAGPSTSSSVRSSTTLESARAGGTTSTTAGTSTTITSAKPGPTTTTTAAPPDPAAFCGDGRASAELVRQISTSLTSPEQLRRLVEDADAKLRSAAPAAPAEAKPAADTLRGTVTTMRAALDAAGYDLARLPPDLVVRFASPEVLDALQRLESSVARSCRAA